MAGSYDVFARGPFNQWPSAPPSPGGELEKLEKSLATSAWADYRGLAWHQRTYTFSQAWDQAQRKRLASLKTYFDSFGPRWLRDDWPHFNQARILADGAGARYEDWIAFQIDRTGASQLKDFRLDYLHDREALSQGYDFFLDESTTPAPEVRSLLRLWRGVDLVAESRAMELVRKTGLDDGGDPREPWQDRLRRLLSLATTDSLTGLANAATLKEKLSQERARLARLEEPLSLILCRVDNFDDFKHIRGEQAGRACLRIVAGLLASQLRRPADLAAYCDDNLYALMLPHTPMAGAGILAETIVQQIREKGILHPNTAAGVVTASCGVAGRVPDRNEEEILLWSEALAALDLAETGRVRHAGPMGEGKS